MLNGKVNRLHQENYLINEYGDSFYILIYIAVSCFVTPQDDDVIICSIRLLM